MAANKTAEPILSIRNVSKQFPGVKALDDVSLDVRRGVVHGIVGENVRRKVHSYENTFRGVYKRFRNDCI